MTTPPASICPGCDQPGALGEPCPELACKKRGYHYIPRAEWLLAHHDPQTQPDAALGQFVGDFLLTRVLGQGGFGKVYLGLQAPLYRLKGAVKLIELDGPGQELLATVLDKFRGEAEALAAMSHPNIVKLLKYGLHQRRPYLVMEFVDGGLTLSEEIHRRRLQGQPVEVSLIEHLITQLLHALEVAHSHNIIHRDIKPDNIMLQDVVGNPHFVRVLDFGLAKFVERSDTTHMAMGTPQYMAPEQLSLKNIGPWTDLYAVGVICYWLLTGQRPFPAERHEDILALKLDATFDPIKPLRERGAPAPVLAFLDDAMAYKTRARIRDVATFRARFEQAMASLRHLPSPPAAPPSQLPPEEDSAELMESMHILFSQPARPPSREEDEDEDDAPASAHEAPTRVQPSSDVSYAASSSGPRQVLGSPQTSDAAQATATATAALVALVALGALIALASGRSPRQPTPLLSEDATGPTSPKADGALAAERVPKTSAQPTDAAADASPEALAELAPLRQALTGGAQPALTLALTRALQARDHAQRPRVVDLALGKFHGCALAWDGRARCWGINAQGELGLGHTTPIGDDETPRLAPWLALGAPALALTAAGDRGASHSCAILRGGLVRCWGANQFGQLGLGHKLGVGADRTPETANPVQLLGPASQLVASASQYAAHTCALLHSGKVQCWGSNQYGQLGLGHTRVIGDDEIPSSAGALDLKQPAIQLAAGKYHTCALLRRGELVCWGFNDKGQLGLGHVRNIGDDEPPWPHGQVKLPRKARAITAGRQHTCALLEDGSVRCWGLNNKGQLGLGDTQDRGHRETVQALPALELGQRATAVAAGDMHTCALLEDGSVRCWGSNQFGQLGLGHKRHIADDESLMTQGPVPLGHPAVELRAGSYHTCAILSTDDVRCWGLNSFGQLGLGHLRDIGDDEAPDSEPPLELLDAP